MVFIKCILITKNLFLKLLFLTLLFMYHFILKQICIILYILIIVFYEFLRYRQALLFFEVIIA